MDVNIPDSLKALRQDVRDFTENELMPLESELHDAEEPIGELRLALENRVKERSLWGLDVPQEYGGQGVGVLASLLIREEASRTYVPSPFAPSVFGLEYSPILRSCRPGQVETFLRPLAAGGRRAIFLYSESGGGSDPSNISTRATRDGKGWTINGTKAFTIGADKADFALVFAVTGDHEELSRRLTCFLVERSNPGLNIGDTVSVMSLYRATEVILQDCRVADEDILGEIGQGLDLAEQALGHWEGQAGAICLGIGGRCQDLSVEFARGRVSFGKPISERQAIQFMISDNAIDMQAARTLVLSYAAKMEEGPDAERERSMAKLFASEMVGRVVDRAIQVHGALGLTNRTPLERFYREARFLRINGVTSEMHRVRLARELLGEDLSL